MSRNLKFALLGLALFSTTAYPQLTPPQATHRERVVENPQMVIRDRGGQVEMLPMLRAVPEVHHGKTYHRIATASAGEGFSKKRAGIVFNHGLQAYGVMTGEISVKLKPSANASALRLPGVQDPTRLAVADIYVIRTRTPSEMVQIYKSLQANNAVEWVEPFIVYGKVLQ
jgi:hypothetical protein